MTRLAAAVVLSALVGIAFGQTTTVNGEATSTVSSVSQTYTVLVGDGDNSFRPDVVQANVGDYIQFNFYPANHSVVRAEYQYPCIPYELTGKGKIGFFTGFKPVDAILPNPPTALVRVNDSLPVFYYCSAPGSCINYQMVGVINPNSTVSLETQKELAKSAKYMLQPGDSFPSEATDIPGASATISSVASTGTAPPATSSAAIPGGDTLHKPLAAGAIAGIVIGVLIIVVLAAALFFFIGHTKSLKESLHRQSIAPSMYNMGHPGQMSPVAPPAAPADQIYHSGGTLYVPIKAADLHRSYGVNNVVLDAHSPVQQGSGGSPGPRYSSASHYEVGSQQQQQQQNDQHRSGAGPIQEMYVAE